MYILDYKSPIGVIEIVDLEEGLNSILFVERGEVGNVIDDETTKVVADCFNQLDEYLILYFSGKFVE